MANYPYVGLRNPKEICNIRACMLVIESHDDHCAFSLFQILHAAGEQFAEGLRSLAREGCLRMIVSDAFLKRAAEEGLRVREYAPPPGGGVQCTVTAEDDILNGRLIADLRGAKRVDLFICDGRGAEQFRLADIPFHTGASSVAYQESISSIFAE